MRIMLRAALFSVKPQVGNEASLISNVIVSLAIHNNASLSFMNSEFKLKHTFIEAPFHKISVHCYFKL